MKVLSKKGLLYADAKYFKEWFLQIFWKTAPERVIKFTKCVPCRMTILLAVPQTVILGYWFGWGIWLALWPFAIGIMSSLFYTIINPNHEEN